MQPQQSGGLEDDGRADQPARVQELAEPEEPTVGGAKIAARRRTTRLCKLIFNSQFATRCRTAFSRRLQSLPYSREWLPSQKGFPPECLQPHQATVPASAMSIFIGPRPVPLCEPSQKGWLLD